MTFQRHTLPLDRILGEFQHALNTTAGVVTRSTDGPAARANPAADTRDLEMSPAQIRHSAGLMRINHTGEVCALLKEDALDELRDQGDLDLHELNSSEPLVLKELVRNLFLYCYARALRP